MRWPRRVTKCVWGPTILLGATPGPLNHCFFIILKEYPYLMSLVSKLDLHQVHVHIKLTHLV
jgi:hypothetical protein